MSKVVELNNVDKREKEERALRDKKILLHDMVDYDSIQHCIDLIERIVDLESNKSEKCDITLKIHSPGGYCDEGLRLVNAILRAKDRGHKVIADIDTAYSMGFIISVVCSERVISRYGRMMYHQISYGAYGKDKDVKEAVEETSKIQDILVEIVLENTKITKEKLDEVYNSKFDWFLSPQEALEYGCVDRIG